MGTKSSPSIEHPHTKYKDMRTRGQIFADNMATFVGSWSYIIIQSVILIAWCVLNVYIALRINEKEAFDPYPFVFLNLLVGFVSAYTGPIVMMSQNRTEERDRLMAEHMYKVALKSEEENREILKRLDVILGKIGVK